MILFLKFSSLFCLFFRIDKVAARNVTRIGYPLPSSLDKDYRFIMDNSFALPLQFEVRTVSHFNTLKNHVGVRERTRIRNFS